MSNNAHTRTKSVTLTAIIAGKHGEATLFLKIPSTTNFVGLSSACLRAIEEQAPNYSGGPVSLIQYDPRAQHKPIKALNKASDVDVQKC